MPATQSLREPLQDRSRRTMERLLEVTETLLNDQPFESISVQQIVRAAKTSVGAFYARFRDKQALLHSLYARYDQSLETRMDELRERVSWEGLDLAGSVRLLVEHLVAFFGERLFLMRALALYARTRPDEIDSDARRRRRRQHQFLHSALLTHRDEIHHPEPVRAVELAIFFAAAACRDRILFAEAPHSESTRLSTAELVHEVTRMVLGYLQNSPALERRTDH